MLRKLIECAAYWTCIACLKEILTLPTRRTTLFVTMAHSQSLTRVHGVSSIGVGRVCGVHVVPMRDLT